MVTIIRDPGTIQDQFKKSQEKQILQLAQQQGKTAAEVKADIKLQRDYETALINKTDVSKFQPKPEQQKELWTLTPEKQLSGEITINNVGFSVAPALIPKFLAQQGIKQQADNYKNIQQAPSVIKRTTPKVLAPAQTTAREMALGINLAIENQKLKEYKNTQLNIISNSPIGSEFIVDIGGNNQTINRSTALKQVQNIKIDNIVDLRQPKFNIVDRDFLDTAQVRLSEKVEDRIISNTMLDYQTQGEQWFNKAAVFVEKGININTKIFQNAKIPNLNLKIGKQEFKAGLFGVNPIIEGVTRKQTYPDFIIDTGKDLALSATAITLRAMAALSTEGRAIIEKEKTGKQVIGQTGALATTALIGTFQFAKAEPEMFLLTAAVGAGKATKTKVKATKITLVDDFKRTFGEQVFKKIDLEGTIRDNFKIKATDKVNYNFFLDDKINLPIEIVTNSNNKLIIPKRVSKVILETKSKINFKISKEFKIENKVIIDSVFKNTKDIIKKQDIQTKELNNQFSFNQELVDFKSNAPPKPAKIKQIQTVTSRALAPAKQNTFLNFRDSLEIKKAKPVEFIKNTKRKDSIKDSKRSYYAYDFKSEKFNIIEKRNKFYDEIFNKPKELIETFGRDKFMIETSLGEKSTFVINKKRKTRGTPNSKFKVDTRLFKRYTDRFLYKKPSGTDKNLIVAQLMPLKQVIDVVKESLIKDYTKGSIRLTDPYQTPKIKQGVKNVMFDRSFSINQQRGVLNIQKQSLKPIVLSDTPKTLMVMQPVFKLDMQPITIPIVALKISVISKSTQRHKSKELSLYKQPIQKQVFGLEINKVQTKKRKPIIPQDIIIPNFTLPQIKKRKPLELIPRPPKELPPTKPIEIVPTKPFIHKRVLVGGNNNKISRKQYLAQKQQAYNVYVKSRGKFKKANQVALNRDNALALGQDATDNTTAATFKLKKVSSSPKRPTKLLIPFKQSKYKLSNNKYIEKNKHRIDSIGELRGITYEGWKANRQKAGFNKFKKRFGF